MKRDSRAWVGFVLAGVVAAASPASWAAPPSPDQAGLAKISPHVIARTEDGSRAQFFVVLAEQADLSEAEKLTTKAEKGRYVYRVLWDTARARQAPIRAWLDARGVPYQPFYIVNALLVEGDRSLVTAMAARPEVARVEANPLVLGIPVPVQPPADVLAPSVVEAVEPNIQYVHAPSVWAMGFTGQGVVVGVQDTGQQWDHQALKGQYRGWDGSAASHDYNWHDSVHSGGGTCGPDSPAPCDDTSHGTHITGTAVGGDGGTNQIGMAPAARWIGCRNMDQGVGTPSTYLECFQFFLAPYPVGGTPAEGRPELAPDVTVNSWACPPSEGCSASTLQSAVDAQRAAGIMTVVAAGNSGPECSTVSIPPAFYEAVSTVGALETGTDDVADFSSRGPVTLDGSHRRKPDISAPGTDVRSSVPGGGYGMLSGTSMATPHVAGAAALVWSAVPGLIGRIDVTENILYAAAVQLPSTVCESSGSPNNVYGYGRLDALAAVLMAMNMPDLTLGKAHVGTFTRGQIGATYTMTVSNVGPTATNGSTVTVTDTLPTGLTATALTGSGWTCTLGTLTCTRSDALANGSSYPAMTLTVTVAGDAPSSVTNTATVSGGGDVDSSNNTATDPTPVRSPTFADVPVTHPFLAWIEGVAAAGITGGCATNPPHYCPDAEITRGQIAVFLLRGIHGAGYEPPAATGMFADVPPTSGFANWIEQLSREGITTGCSTSPPEYCPDAGVTRGQMAVFLLRAQHGAGYDPPAATGTMFADVPDTHPFAKWIEQLAREGISGGCSASPLQYCPDVTVTRGQMAVFLARTFNLPL